MKNPSNDYRKGVRAYAAKDYEKARRLLLVFAEEGDARALTMIASVYQLGLGGISIDYDKAAAFYLLASKKGSGQASNNLGTMALLRGDSAEAIEYYQLARRQVSGTLPRSHSCSRI